MNYLVRILRFSTAAVCLTSCAAGCRHTIAVEPIEVKPIHMTLDINLKVDRELDAFFDDIASPEPTTQPESAAPPATAPSDQGGQS